MSKEIECGMLGQPHELIRIGPQLKVQIGFDTAFEVGRDPVLPSTLHDALVDTGAFLSCIDSTVANSLQLPIVDRQMVAGVHGAHEVNIHLSQIIVPELQLILYGRFAGVHLQAGGQPYSALLGRLFLEKIKMVYNGVTGSVVITSLHEQ